MSGTGQVWLVMAIGIMTTLTGASAIAQGGPERDPPVPAYVLTNHMDRTLIDLTGAWHWSVDPYRDGMAGFHGGEAGFGHRRYDTTDVDTFTRDNPAALFEYDMRRERVTTLPGAWIGHDPALRYYDDVVWYAKEFEADTTEGARAFVRVGAANYEAHVYLNGEKVGTHEGGFTPFSFEVTDLIQDGENLIVIGVDARRSATSVPPTVTDWETYGGITRPVSIVFTPETFIDRAWVRLTENGDIAATIELDGPGAANRTVSIDIETLGVTIEGRTNGEGMVEASIPAPDDLALWSPESPTLYDITITGGTDTLHERIGFRTITIDGTDILLNGEPVYLRGISLHEEELGADPARIMTEPAIRALLSEIKHGLNGNFVRLAHYPHTELTTRIADEMGLLVWSEIPVYWLIDWENEETLATARGMLAENITRDLNRASIVVWSVANETPIGDARNAFLRRLIADVRALDGSRPVTAALLTASERRDGTMVNWIDDPLAEDLDLLAINTYNGWYGDWPLDRVNEIEWEDRHGKPMLFSELGAGALAGFHDPDVRRKFSEDYQAEYYRQTLAMSDNIPHLKGMSPWILKDFRSPRRQHPVYQQGWNRKGLISETGQRKQAFHVLSDYYRQKAED